MNLPKQRIYRALVKSGTCKPEHLKEIDRKLNYDREVQQEFLRFYRKRKGRLFTGLRSLVNWVIMHREEIMTILGIAVMFLDEEPDHAEKPSMTTETPSVVKPVVLPPKVDAPEEDSEPTPPAPIFDGWGDEDEDEEDDYKDGTLWSPGE